MAATTDNCKPDSGRFKPVIDVNRCEGKEDCVRVCPYDVFELRPLTDDEWRGLSFFARIRVKVHGGKQGFVVKPMDCHACGLCVKACPEKAIKLERAGG